MRNELAELFGGLSELFVERESFQAWLASAKVKAGGLQSADGVQAAMLAYEQREIAPRLVGDVAVIDVCGPIFYKSSWLSYYFGLATIMDLQRKLAMAVQDPAVRTICFRFDSPGGEVTMVPEFADEIFAARGQKPIVAVADTLVASAAYWLAASAETIYTSVSGRLGSIGVYTEHVDYSQMLDKAGLKVTLISHGAHKVDGNPYEPLPDDVRARIQARVDEIGNEFEAAVARGRGVSKKDVVDTFGQGEVFRGKRAIALGMADKMGTFSQVIAKLTKNRAGGTGIAASTEQPAVPDDAAKADEDSTPCQSCVDSKCDCEEPECPEDCPTCDPECNCRAEAKAKAQAAADADALTAALSE